jgi:gliding motility-associated-like protein
MRDTTICQGDQIQLKINSDGFQYSWLPATQFQDAKAKNPLVSTINTTTYIVTVTAGACTHNDTFIVHVLPSPVADFTYTPTTPVPNAPIQFTNKSTNALSYTWTFGDGTGSTSTNASHLYKRSGSYEVCLTAANAACTDSVCQTVKADVRVAAAVPLGFTPNGDGVNDVLLVRGSNIETMNLVIYNRWGQKVFESSSQTQGWDGTYNGKPQGIDIYAYVLRATFTDGSSTVKQGNINLLR